MTAMDPGLADRDDAALRKLAQIERARRVVAGENVAVFISSANAVEVRLENSPRAPETIRLLAQALRPLGRSHGIAPAAAGFAEHLVALLRYDSWRETVDGAAHAVTRYSESRS